MCCVVVVPFTTLSQMRIQVVPFDAVLVANLNITKSCHVDGFGWSALRLCGVVKLNAVEKSHLKRLGVI